MIRTKAKVLAIAASVVMCVASMVASAADEMKPFILGSIGSGTVADTVMDVKKALTNNGFTVAGEYSPYEAAHIIIVTNAALKKVAASHKRAGYAAGQRVAVTRVGDQIQVSYTNPAYMTAAYQIKGNVSGITEALKKALGAEKRVWSRQGFSS